MTEQAILNEKFSENDLNLWNTANGWKKITIDDHGLGLQIRRSNKDNLGIIIQISS